MKTPGVFILAHGSICGSEAELKHHCGRVKRKAAHFMVKAAEMQKGTRDKHTPVTSSIQPYLILERYSHICTNS